ncbi:TIGR02453 family protein [Streptosporangium carneum]|uniref:TIGR02453 family protein n=2 Tax=Streptosporangium carneum TaxID=47481 RepID=A0A9W6MI56_9ACTN|nr:TIGR02453 family protein [Streptosporangium carneum]
MGGMGFNGFPDEAFVFYEGLEADNSKTYWARHRQVYEDMVKVPMTALGEELEAEFGRAHLFRPNRDVRFSKDKSPYKTHQGAYVATGEAIGYYVQLDAAGLHVGAGLYAAQGEQLARYRQAVDEEISGVPLEKIVTETRLAGYEIGGDRLKTRPRGVPEDHPRLDLLRHRSLHASRRFEPEAWVHTPEVLGRVRVVWRDLVPLVEWLTVHLPAD